MDDDRADALCSSSCNMRMRNLQKESWRHTGRQRPAMSGARSTARARSQRARHARDHRIVTRSMLRSDALICRSPTSAGRIRRLDTHRLNLAEPTTPKAARRATGPPGASVLAMCAHLFNAANARSDRLTCLLEPQAVPAHRVSLPRAAMVLIERVSRWVRRMDATLPCFLAPAVCLAYALRLASPCLSCALRAACRHALV